eukprot:399753_1
MRTSILQVLTVVVAIIAVLMYSNTKNCRVYEMNEIECIVLQSMHGIFSTIFQFQHKIIDAYSESPNQNISQEYRAFRDIFTILNKINEVINPIESSQQTFLHKGNKSLNILQYIVPIPKSTKISSQYINLDATYVQKELNINIRSSSSITDYSKFYPQNTRIIWLIGDDNVQNTSQSKTIIYIHGGSYIFGGASHLGFASHLSIATKTRVAYICYDAAPKVNIPYQVDQILTVYFYLLLKMKIVPKHIIIAGDSAGGGLNLLSVQKLGSNKLEHMYPNGIILLSPWIDLGLHSESYEIHKENDIIIHIDGLKRCGKIVTENDENNFKNGFYSALYGYKLNIMPRMYFVVSKQETLFDDSKQLIRKFKDDTDDTCDIKYEFKDYMPHDWVLFVDLFPEADESFANIVQIIVDWFAI